MELSATSRKAVTVPYAVGRAGQHAQGAPVMHGSLVIKPGRLSAMIDVELSEISPEAGEEVLEIVLSGPENASLGRIPVHRMTVISREHRPRIAVIPFMNVSGRKDAGDLLMLQFVKELSSLDDITVMEPGVVRDHLLGMRVIMYEGVSLSDIDLLMKTLDVDLILTGRVFDYQDYEAPGTTPKVEFSVLLFERTRNRVIWASKSYNKGNDGVVLFDWGNISTANTMVTEMARAVKSKLVTWE